MTAAPLLGHQGGWDEILYFALPFLVVAVIVGWADRRARRRRGEAGSDGAEEDPHMGANIADSTTEEP